MAQDRKDAPRLRFQTLRLDGRGPVDVFQAWVVWPARVTVSSD